jgi:hypothetical protein
LVFLFGWIWKFTRYCEASRLKAATGWRTTFLLYTVKSPNSTEQGENMIDHYYVTHAQILALRNVVAFIVQTMPEEQKENVLQVLRKFAEIELMDGIDAPPTSDITPKTVEKLNKAYKAIFNDIIDLSTPGRICFSTLPAIVLDLISMMARTFLSGPFSSLLSRNSIFFVLVIV